MAAAGDERFNVLLIDAQNDFADDPVDYNGVQIPGGPKIGRLPVVGAGKDLARVAKFLTDNKDNIEGVYASMDTHTIGHIGHSLLRKVSDKTIIMPSTVVTTTADNKIVNKFVPADEYEANVPDAHIPAMNRYIVAYIRGVESTAEEKGRNSVNTWNTHCIEGTKGWDFHPKIKDALTALGPKVHYFIKGQNQLAEMYSIFQAEVPYENIVAGLSAEDQAIVKQYVYNSALGGTKEDPVVDPTNTNAAGSHVGPIPPSPLISSGYHDLDKTVFPTPGARDINLETTFNEELFRKLTAHDRKIVVCGEALSHCVQFSARDLIEKIKERKHENNEPFKNNVVLIENGSSPVLLPPIDDTNTYLNGVFRTSAETFIADMKANSWDIPGGTGVMTIADIAAGGARRNRSRRNRNNKRTRNNRRNRTRSSRRNNRRSRNNRRQ